MSLSIDLGGVGIDSCLLLRYFNVNKGPHGGGRGPRQKTQQLKNQSLSPVVIAAWKGLVLKLINFPAGSGKTNSQHLLNPAKRTFLELLSITSKGEKHPPTCVCLCLSSPNQRRLTGLKIRGLML